MSWVDVVDESTRNLTHPTRPPRPTYIPPHLRHTYNNAVSHLNYDHPSSFNFPTHPTPSRPRFNPNEHGRSSRTRGGGRGRNSFLGGPNPNSFDIADKFEKVEVTEDDQCNDNAINFDAYEDIPVEASGSDIPKPVSSFVEIDLCEALQQNIKRCKYVKPTPIQRHAIPIAIAGRDLMACAQTGSGKTAAFCFPIICGIMRDRLKLVVPGGGMVKVAYPTALILSPTRELSCQIHDEANKFAHRTGVRIVVAYGGASIGQQFHNLEKGVDLLVATPGRLVDMIERGRVSLKMIKYLALDEADRMLDMGFEHQIRKIVEQMDMPPPGARQTMLFSATFPDEIQRLASDFLSDYIFLTVGKVGSSIDLIAQRVEFVQDMDKRSHLLNLLCSQNPNRTRDKPSLTLVFVETKRGADALEHWLLMKGFPAIAIHGDKVQRERERALKSFKRGSTPILVATDVASRGLDIPRVAHVINFDLPKAIDDYVHRIGRTGRAGNSGLATAFFSDKKLPLAKPLVELMNEAKQEVPSWLSEYAENSPCGGRGQGSRYGHSNKFGGYDFRRSSIPSSAVGYSEYYGVDSSTQAADNSATANGEFYAVGYNTEYCSTQAADNSATAHGEFYAVDYNTEYCSTQSADDSATAHGEFYAVDYNTEYYALPANSDAYPYLNVGSVVASGWD
ncbi:DEAD-box ATP-dependent RNA helicase 52C-like [Pistacia vera]|uniref:DEAD-box ATP-dependent RNA helicase 52C-like n=1 Tax=Pistacia vera TaxID=55513 RepID=UPI0012632ED2|nr:DEAD-box ATP-dependent RNA helicase 52C-like [Pistacia vera]